MNNQGVYTEKQWSSRRQGRKKEIRGAELDDNSQIFERQHEPTKVIGDVSEQASSGLLSRENIEQECASLIEEGRRDRVVIRAKSEGKVMGKAAGRIFGDARDFLLKAANIIEAMNNA